MYAAHHGDARPGTAGRAHQLPPSTEQLEQRFRSTLRPADTGLRPASSGRSRMAPSADAPNDDALTTAIDDLLDASDPHTLLTSTRDALFSAYGPFDGERRARDYATALLYARRMVGFSRTVALHHPDQPFLPDDEWLPLPAALALRARANAATVPATVLVLLDQVHRLFAVVGPFTHHGVATTWHPSTPLPDRVHRLPLGLQPAVTTWTNA